MLKRCSGNQAQSWKGTSCSTRACIPRSTGKNFVFFMIAQHFRSTSIDLVAGPVTGGIILAFEVARQLGKRAIYAENEGNKKTFRRGAIINPGDRILIVDDVMTAGGSINDVVTAVNERQGKIIGVGVLVDRSDKTPDFGVPLFSCLRTTAIAYAPDKCPQCAAKVPLTKPGGS
jgi:orotate phosphoribosyltransferase